MSALERGEKEANLTAIWGLNNQTFRTILSSKMADTERTDLGNERPPIVRPSQEEWDYCVELAKKHNKTPLEVANRLMDVGTRLAMLEEKGEGEFIYRKTADNSEVEIRIFKKGQNASK